MSDRLHAAARERICAHLVLILSAWRTSPAHHLSPLQRPEQVYAYSGESPTDATLPDLLPDVAPIYGDRCAVQSLTSANDDASNPLAVIKGLIVIIIL